MENPKGTDYLYYEALLAGRTASCRYGCTNKTMTNYDSRANRDDGSCKGRVLGCTDSRAENFDTGATVNNGNCRYKLSQSENQGPCSPPRPIHLAFLKVASGCHRSSTRNIRMAATKDHWRCPPPLSGLGQCGSAEREHTAKPEHPRLDADSADS